MCLAPCSIVLVVLRTRSYRTLRDGSFEGRFSRHFVPGYDRLSLRDAPADISQQPLAKACCENVPEGRCDRSLARSAWKSATLKSRPVGYGVIEYEGRRRVREGLGQDAKQIQNHGLSPLAPFGAK